MKLGLKKQKKIPAHSSNSQRLSLTKNRIIKQAVLVGFIAVVIVVLLFAITTAWYTNVVQTKGLTFEAETWGFEGGVNVDADEIAAMPGDEGVIRIEAENTADETSALTVNINKEFMDQKLQQRIYFFADETRLLNGEQVQRQYMTNTEGHTYMVEGGSRLVLSDEACSDTPLKWQWVYDVVGYYFTGVEENGVLTVLEYLRPVEYDYFQAQYDDNGRPVKVDSETTIEEFIQAQTESDGYLGALRVDQNANGDTILRNTFYNAEVEMVKGSYLLQRATDTEPALYLYLCGLNEIEENTRWDTAFVAQELSERSFSARITITGMQVNKEIVALADSTALAAALSENDGKIVQLQQDVALSAPISIPMNVDTELDLNSYTLRYTGTGQAFQVSSESALTIANGSVTGNGSNEAFRSVGGRLTLRDVHVENVFTAVRIEDYMSAYAQGANSLIRIVNSNLKSVDDTIVICGDGVASTGKTMLVIQNSSVESETYAGILGKGNNANPSQWGTDIQIIGSTIKGYYTGIYHPMQQSILTVSDGSTVWGITGIAMKGGDLRVIDSTVSGIGTGMQIVDMTQEPALNMSGWLDSGDGIYVESNYEYPVRVTVSGDSHVNCVAETARAIRVYPEAEHVRVELSGGQYSSDVTDFVANGYICQFYAGTYTVSPLG